MRSTPIGLTLVFLAAIGCATNSRGPVDRSVDAAHATNRTVGESVDAIDEGPGSVVVDALTFPFRLIGRVANALFG